MSFWKWLTSPSSNAGADPSINWAEGQAPSSVNDSARAMMAALRKFANDISGGTITSTGSANTYAITTEQGLTSLTDGFQVSFKLNVAPTGASTINVDGLGAKPLRAITGTALSSGDMTAGSVYTIVYEATGDEWLIIGGAGGSGGGGGSGDVTFSAFGEAFVALATAALARTALELGTAATRNTGTSGTALGLLDTGNTHSGNNTFSGTNTHSGTNTFSGANTFSHATNTFSNSAGVTAENTAKAYGHASISGSSLTHRDGFNGTWARSSAGVYVFTFGTAMADQYYSAIPAVHSASNARTITIASQSTSAVTVHTRAVSDGSLSDVDGVSVVVFR